VKRLLTLRDHGMIYGDFVEQDWPRLRTVVSDAEFGDYRPTDWLDRCRRSIIGAVVR
jgi:hypothetical protein